uniref:Putative secreted protein n=1 Tax=Panstrongylus lignarius TaxID=156445 RepID=A0A224Y5D8_9HEMI
MASLMSLIFASTCSTEGKSTLCFSQVSLHFRNSGSVNSWFDMNSSLNTLSWVPCLNLSPLFVLVSPS